MAITTHPGVTSALLGPRTIEHLDSVLAGADVVLSDDILDRIDEIVPPGSDVSATPAQQRADHDRPRGLPTVTQSSTGSPIYAAFKPESPAD
jgi:hypothetical protein